MAGDKRGGPVSTNGQVTNHGVNMAGAKEAEAVASKVKALKQGLIVNEVEDSFEPNIVDVPEFTPVTDVIKESRSPFRPTIRDEQPEDVNVVEEPTYVSPVEDFVIKELDEDPDEDNPDDISSEPSELSNTYPLKISGDDNDTMSRLVVSPLDVEEANTLVLEWMDLIELDSTIKGSIEMKMKDKKVALELHSKQIEDNLELTFNTVDAIEDKFKLNEDELNHVKLDLSADEVRRRNGLISNGRTFTNPTFDTDGMSGLGYIKEAIMDKSRANKNPVAHFNSVLGLSSPVMVNFPNSGFSIRFRPPKKIKEAAKFINECNSDANTIGAALGNVADNSFEMLKLNKHALELARKLTIGSTLNTEDPVAYLSNDDFGVLQLALLATIYPKGLPISVPCIGNGMIIPNSGGKTECTNVKRGTILSDELLYVDVNKIAPSLLPLSSRTELNSISLDELIVARGEIPNYTEVIKFNGVDVRFTFGSSMTSEYLNLGDIALTEANELLKEAYNKDDNTDVLLMEAFASSPIKSSVLLKEIEVGGVVTTDHGDLVNLVDNLSGDNQLLIGYYNAMNNYTIKNPVAIGMPAYACGCGKSNTGNFGLKPINPLSLFIGAVSMNA